MYLNDDFYDLVDADSFGSDAMHLAAALDAVAFGGLLYLTCTDGYSASGKSPERALAAFGAYTRAVPWAPEQVRARVSVTAAGAIRAPERQSNVCASRLWMPALALACMRMSMRVKMRMDEHGHGASPSYLVCLA